LPFENLSSFGSFLLSLWMPAAEAAGAMIKDRSAPLPDKPSGRGLFGLPEGTGAAPITGAPAAHCFKLLRHGLENLAGSDQKHHEYVLVLDCTVADGAGDSFYGRVAVARKLLIRPGETLFSTFVTLGLKKSPWQRFRYVVQLVP